ncbi:threonine--tRNA ligase [Gluconobacter cerinus]|uniref:Threonine--tRNA ligase n=1 Tax=Gluconobacter cerinus TaxID=38307 RepID=A0AAV5NJH8_9PROT|nr:threonine--tRNA ligase [Gluconobacter cerinus]
MDGIINDLSSTTADQLVDPVFRSDTEALSLIRHDTAHVLAQAVSELFPNTALATGPATEQGFFYDFAAGHAFTDDDLIRIESRMHEIIDRDETIVREEWDRERALSWCGENGQPYKAEIIMSLPADVTLSFYRQGNFVDLCRGPHLVSTGQIGHAFRLLSTAGAYWKGDRSNPMLQRIHGTACRDADELAAWEQRQEAAARRDHRRLGREMDLFHFQAEAPGAVFWHPNGWTLFQTLHAYLRERQKGENYVEINTPDIMDLSLWQASGHWEKFGENMFTTETEGRIYALKPMNCPGGVQVFRQGLKSYRDLPLRMAEFGKVHRFEPSGALHGLMRVRAFTQDDAHIFCTPEQMEAETQRICHLVLSIYKTFGFDDVRIKFSDRPEKRIGSDEIWDCSEEALQRGVEASGLSYTRNRGEGAFYGPKLEFVLRDAIGRDWQCGTVQVDLNLPQRLDAHYIGADGEKHPPVMLHRALFGSLERFIGILLEHHAGHLPFWLAPIQVVVATITGAADKYAVDLIKALRQRGVRAEPDLRNEKIAYKIREHSLAKVPMLLIVGKKEAQGGTVSIREYGSSETPILDMESAINLISKASESRLAQVF